MLAAARAKAAECGASVRFVEAGVRRFALSQSFELVLFPNNSPAHLHTLADIRACFACVRRHLAPGGRFAVEMFSPFLTLLTRSFGTHYPVAEYQAPDSRAVSVTETVDYDAATQISHAVWHCAHEDGLVRACPLDLRTFFPQELDALLVFSGFVIEAKYGGFDKVWRF